jgi:hypothetical protein
MFRLDDAIKDFGWSHPSGIFLEKKLVLGGWGGSWVRTCCRASYLLRAKNKNANIALQNFRVFCRQFPLVRFFSVFCRQLPLVRFL